MSSYGWGAEGNGFALVAAVDAEIFTVDCQNRVVGIEFAQPDQAKIGEIGCAIAVTFCQGSQMRLVVLTMKGEPYQAGLDHLQYKWNATKVERGFRHHGFACQQWFCYLLGNTHGPGMVQVACVGEGDEEACVGDAFHVFEKPFRVDNLASSLTVPAKRMNGRL